MYISSYLFPCVLVTVRFSHQHHRSLFTQHSDCTHRSPAPLSQQSSPLRHTYIHASFNKKKPSFSWASQGTTRRQPLLLRLRYTSRLLLRLCCSIIYTHTVQPGVWTHFLEPANVGSVCSSVAAHAASPLTHILRWWNGAPSSGQIPIITNN